MLILCQHHYSESKVWDLCGLRPHNLLIDCNPVLSTEPTGPHCESLTMLSYIELSFQAPSYDHNLLTRVYTLTPPTSEDKLSMYKTANAKANPSPVFWEQLLGLSGLFEFKFLLFSILDDIFVVEISIGYVSQMRLMEKLKSVADQDVGHIFVLTWSEWRNFASFKFGHYKKRQISGFLKLARVSRFETVDVPQQTSIRLI